MGFDSKHRLCYTALVFAYNNLLLLRAALKLGGSKLLIIRVNKPAADATISFESLGNRTAADEPHTARKLAANVVQCPR